MDEHGTMQPVANGPLADGNISYLFILTYDFGVMLTFYRDALGFRVAFAEDGVCAFLRLADGAGPQIALYSGRDRVADVENHWFIVINVKDIDGVVAELRRRGVQIGEIGDVPYGRAAKLRDPEKNVIEIHEPTE